MKKLQNFLASVTYWQVNLVVKSMCCIFSTDVDDTFLTAGIFLLIKAVSAFLLKQQK